MALAAASVAAAPIRTVAPQFDAGIGPLGKIGFISLANGTTSEFEVAAMLPEGMVLYISRTPSDNVVNLTNLKAIETGLIATTKLILPDGKLDVMIYGCTSGTVALGEDVVEARIRAVRPNIKVTTPITGCLAAFRALRKKKVVLLTPYIAEVTSAVRDYMNGRGLEVLDAANFNVSLNSDMVRITPEAVAEAAIALDRPDAEAIFISCTALRTSTIIERIERATGKPCVTSNQALAWHAMRLAGYAATMPGLGRLMTLPAA
jgi:maleate isomerase